MDEAGAKRLLEVLNAEGGIICAVGAGGKKSTLYRLAQAHHVVGSERVGLTATVMLATPPAKLFGAPLIGEQDTLATSLMAALADRRLVAFAAPSSKPGRLAGLGAERISEIHANCDFTATLVKADGARMRLIKAPSEEEPVLPANVSTILPIVSAKAIGRPLNPSIAHRLERLCWVTGASPNENLTPLHVARLLVSDAGALHKAGNARVVPIINMVDDASSADAAREAAHHTLATTRRLDRVVLTSMAAEQPLIEVVSSRT
ncbi:MAG: selenium cofactor biosynthesis protein YqeC [Pseudomonadota bacterium]